MGPEVMAAMAFVSTAVGVVGQLTQQSAQSSMSSYSAQVADMDAQAARAAANSDAEDIRRKGRLTQSGLRAGVGASGLIADQGSPYELLLDNAAEIELEAQRRIARGETDATRYTNQANLDRYRANVNGPNYLQAGASLIDGGFKAYKILSTPAPGQTRTPTTASAGGVAP